MATIGEQSGGPADLGSTGHAVLHPLALNEAAITGGLWADRQRINREILLPDAAGRLESAGNFHNLRVAAGQESGPFRGLVFMDSDVYKWLEALGWEFGRAPDEKLARLADEAIALVADAQEDDGYLNSYYQVAQPGERFCNLAQDHELYCAGHLIQAAIAQSRVRGEERLLEVARRFADHIDRVFSGGARRGPPGHPEIETALVELYRQTREPRYLRLAQYFVDERGHRLLGRGHFGSSYFQDHVPVRAATEVTGHAVRALYLAAGVTDIYLETGERELLAAMEAQWHDMAARKTYITGGLGAHHQDEAFGDPYELPPDRCYGETCAAIASIMWNWRMLLATGEARYSDLLERTLYNAFLAGLALDGHGFSYVNPLQVREHHRDPVERGARRQPWYECACCPPNVMRLLASLQHYLATADEDGLQVHQYATGRLGTDRPYAGRIEIAVSTDYPWDGIVELEVMTTPSAPWTLTARVPSWAAGARVTINDEPLDIEEPGLGYVSARREWRVGDRLVLELPMAVRLIAPHPRIDAVRGCVAIERGPLVYCVEQVDLPAGVSLDDLVIEPSAPLQTATTDHLLPGTVAVKATAVHVPPRESREPWPYAEHGSVDRGRKAERLELTAIPYALWGNRDEGPMRVWVPTGS
jgi:uncharacterized protein